MIPGLPRRLLYWWQGRRIAPTRMPPGHYDMRVDRIELDHRQRPVAHVTILSGPVEERRDERG